MNKYADFVYETGTNNPVVGVLVTIYQLGTTTPATLYDSNGAVLLTPLVTDATGYFEVWLDTGTYDVYVLGDKFYAISVNELTNVPDPLVVGALTVSSTASLPASTSIGSVTPTQISYLGALTSGIQSAPTNAMTRYGYLAMTSVTNIYGTAVGYLAAANVTGHYCVAVGYRALGNGTCSGSSGIAIGKDAMLNATGCDRAIAIGESALIASVSTYQAIAIGTSALASCASGDDNIAIGAAALYSHNLGHHNIGIGNGAGYNVTQGGNSIFIGRSSGADPLQKVNPVNSIAIGANSYSTKDNQMVLGGPDITETLVSGTLKLRTVPPNYTGQADALANGLTAGCIYRTGEALKVVY